MSAAGEKRSGRGDVTVREIVAADVLAVSTILQESPLASAWSSQNLLESAQSGISWVAEENGVVIGFLIGRAVGDEFEILNLAVAASRRRVGVATRLLEAMSCWGTTAGIRRTYLEVRASNEAAMALYVQNNFETCGRRVRYYQYPTEDAIVLFLDTPQTP